MIFYDTIRDTSELTFGDGVSDGIGAVEPVISDAWSMAVDTSLQFTGPAVTDIVSDSTIAAFGDGVTTAMIDLEPVISTQWDRAVDMSLAFTEPIVADTVSDSTVDAFGAGVTDGIFQVEPIISDAWAQAVDNALQVAGPIVAQQVSDATAAAFGAGVSGEFAQNASGGPQAVNNPPPTAVNSVPGGGIISNPLIPNISGGGGSRPGGGSRSSSSTSGGGGGGIGNQGAFGGMAVFGGNMLHSALSSSFQRQFGQSFNFNDHVRSHGDNIPLGPGRMMYIIEAGLPTGGGGAIHKIRDAYETAPDTLRRNIGKWAGGHQADSILQRMAPGAIWYPRWFAPGRRSPDGEPHQAFYYNGATYTGDDVKDVLAFALGGGLSAISGVAAPENFQNPAFLFRGGITTGPTMGMLSEFGQPEMVVPLEGAGARTFFRQLVNEFRATEGLGFQASPFTALHGNLPGGGGGGSFSVTIQPAPVMLDGRVVGQVAFPHIEQQMNAKMANILG